MTHGRRGTNGANVAVDALATFRLTKLLQQDTVPPLPRLRATVARHLDGSPWMDLLDCPWCLSVWVGLGVAVLRRVCPRLWGLASAGLAASAVTGLLSQVAAELDRDDEVQVRVVEPKG